MQKPVTPPARKVHTRDALRLLVVDDDAFQIEVNADMLRALGVVDITTATSGEQALQAVHRNHGAFDVMLCDLYMPGMDGFQFMDNVARSGFTGGVIIVSGQSTEVVHSASLVAQLRRFKLLGALSKPVNRTQLGEMLNKALG
jgi:CheY-like chemotaxis protein